MVYIFKNSNLSTQTENKIILQLPTYYVLEKQNRNGVVISLCTLNLTFKMVKVNIFGVACTQLHIHL